MATVIQPTVGRVVWYFPNTTQPIYASGEPLAAIVCHVHSDRMVNLDVIDHLGFHHPMTSVVLLQEGDQVPTDPYCRWMPFQLGQAKKQIEDAGETKKV